MDTPPGPAPEHHSKIQNDIRNVANSSCVELMNIFSEDSSNDSTSYHSFEFCKSPKKINCGTFVPHVDVEAHHEILFPRIPLCSDADYSTPKTKSNGFNNTVRRKLSFSPSIQSSSNDSGNDSWVWNAVPTPPVPAAISVTTHHPCSSTSVSAVEVGGCGMGNEINQNSSHDFNQSFQEIMNEIMMSHETPYNQQRGQLIPVIPVPLPPIQPIHAATYTLVHPQMNLSYAPVAERKKTQQRKQGQGVKGISKLHLPPVPAPSLLPSISTGPPLISGPPPSFLPPINPVVPAPVPVTNTNKASLVPVTKPRKFAQLVVWTKNAGNKLNTNNKNSLAIKEQPPAKTLLSLSPSLPAPTPKPSFQLVTSSTPKDENKENLVPEAVFPSKVQAVDLETIQEQKANKKESSEGDLFFVHYPVRSLTETCKNKGNKAQKRSRKVSPIASPNSLQEGQIAKKKSRKQKRSSSILAQGATSGRAYRTYLHSCLEKQRQQLRTGADFKVEKLFQPDQGVSLPGEILPAINEHITGPLTSAAQTQSLVTVEQQPPVVLFPILTPVTTNEKVSLETTSTVSAPLEPIDHDNNFSIVIPSEEAEFAASITIDSVPSSTSDPLVVDESCKSNICAVPTCSVPTESIPTEEGGTKDATSFLELPDSFTITTTEPLNEFDLLIQNVIHEEMVGHMGEEDNASTPPNGCENPPKRMKIGGVCSRTCSEESINDPGKPRCTYTELIEKALTESGGLTVSEIYNWISDRYPFYKPDDDRWKNSVRHNLSINPYFKKGEKARNGAGHLWTISEESKGLRPSMVSCWDERRKSPSDPLEFEMPMESETDRAVANILGRYISECRASQEATAKDKEGSKDTSRQPIESVPSESPQQPTENQCQPDSLLHALANEQTQKVNETGAMCNLETSVAPSEFVPLFNINELNGGGQLTVDLSGIEIPEGGAINFEELVNNGRLIYVQTSDADANKENESSQTIVLNDGMLTELSSLTNNGNQEETRFQSFYTDPMSLDLLGKGVDSIPSTSYDASQINLATATTSTSAYSTANCIGSSCNIFQHDTLATDCTSLAQCEISTESQRNADLTVLDQVMSMTSYEDTSSAGNPVTGNPTSLPTINAAAMYESKELGVSYIYQTEPGSHHDLMQ